MSVDRDSQLNQWLEMLRSPEESDRLVAVKTLQHLGDEESIDASIAALQDKSTAVQKIAIARFNVQKVKDMYSSFCNL